MKKKILFVGRYPVHFHYYRSILESLIERGYTVLLLLAPVKGDIEENDIGPITSFAEKHPRFSFEEAKKSKGRKQRVLIVTRELINYRNYLTISGRSRVYMERTYTNLPPMVQKILSIPGCTFFLKTRVAHFLLWLVERILPPDSHIVEHIKLIDPAMVFAAPVNMKQKRGTPDLEYLKAAKSLGIPTIVPVISWDNLTNKGQIHILPDRVFVWNNLQYGEARKYHDIPKKILKITGAPLFDQWFDNLKPSMSREQFFKTWNLPLSHKYILYLGSSKNITGGTENNVVRLLRDALVDQKNEIQNMHIVVRPHPSNAESYEKDSFPEVTLVPRGGMIPSGEKSLQLFFDTLYYAAAVVGINCSAMIESLIAGKPVVAYKAPEYRATQSDTEHFRWLESLKVVSTPETPEHFVKVLNDLLLGIDECQAARDDFVKNYIRPRGVSESAGSVAAREAEEFLK